MYCTRCGATNPDEASFCGNCGTSLKGAPAPATPTRSDASCIVTYAGFWRRLGASLIDGLILGTAGFALAMVILVPAMVGSEAGAFGGIAIFYVVAIGGEWLYYTLMESSAKQATLGKMALGIIVTDTEGNRISFGRATGRFFGRMLSGLILYIGFIMIAFTEKKQGLHDMLAGTLVVEK